MIINEKQLIRYLIPALAILLTSCKEQSEKSKLLNDAKNPITIIQENEEKATRKESENYGELITRISFQVKTENIKDYEDGFIPWVSIEKANQDIQKLDKKDEIVIKENSVKIIIDYPLTNQYEFSLMSLKGFTRAQLLSEISHHYFKIYKEEENSATVKTIPINERTTIENRNQTNGKYGIWGHDIRDLDLSEIKVFKAENGQIVLILNIES